MDEAGDINDCCSSADGPEANKDQKLFHNERGDVCCEGIEGEIGEVGAACTSGVRLCTNPGGHVGVEVPIKTDTGSAACATTFCFLSFSCCSFSISSIIFCIVANIF